MIFSNGNTQGNSPSYYDVGYGIASVAITNGTVVVATTAADYIGYSVITTSAAPSIRIYDSTGTTAGNLLDIVIVGSNSATRVDRYIPVKARLGIVASIVNGTGASGVIFYAPKG